MDARTELKEATDAGTRSIRFYAVDMLRSQGCTLTAEHRAALIRQANALRVILGTSEPQTLSVPVYDVYQKTVKLGWATFTF